MIGNAITRQGASSIMNLQSMTGFARAVAEHDGAVDRLGGQVGQRQERRGPAAAAARLRAAGAGRPADAAEAFSRGNFQATLTVGRAAGAAGAAGGQRGFLKDLAGLAKRLQEQFGVAPATRRRAARAARRARHSRKQSRPRRSGPRSTPRSCRRWTRRLPVWSRRARARAKRCVRCSAATSTPSRR